MRKDPRLGHVEAGQMLRGPGCESPGPTHSHLPELAQAAHPGNASRSPLATAPFSARLHPLLTSSSGVRVSRSPQQQHHLQQQHRGLCIPPSSSFTATLYPSAHLPPTQGSAPHVTGPGSVVALSSLRMETGSGCRRVGRGVASHDGGGPASSETSGRGHIGGGASGGPRGRFPSSAPAP